MHWRNHAIRSLSWAQRLSNFCRQVGYPQQFLSELIVSFSLLLHRVQVRGFNVAPNNTNHAAGSGVENRNACATLISRLNCVLFESDIFCFLNVPGANVLHLPETAFFATSADRETAGENRRHCSRKPPAMKAVQTFNIAAKDSKSQCVQRYPSAPCIPSQRVFSDLFGRFSTHRKLLSDINLNAALRMTEQLVVHKVFLKKAFFSRRLGNAKQVRWFSSTKHPFTVVHHPETCHWSNNYHFNRLISIYGSLRASAQMA